MKYMMMIYGAETEMTPEEGAASLQEYQTFNASLKDHEWVGEALQPTPTATTVRVREGQTLTTDGPFAESREQIGGFYMVDCADLDEALEIAARIPGAKYGTVEVRPVFPTHE
jgi:hypothetical protein